MMKKITLFSLTALLLLAFGTPGLMAQDNEYRTGFRGWGPRLGATLEPDQVHFGVHADLGNFAERIRFQPNFELGFGDDITLMAFNFDAAYRFATNWNVWSPYLGGGVGLNVYSFDTGPLEDETNTEVGVNLVGGIEKGLRNGDRFFIEGKVGLADAPDFKVAVGWTFYH